jgi:hypothetical protein
VTVRLPLDCRAPAIGADPVISAKIEAIPRHGVSVGVDLGHEKETVKKIA